MDNIFLKENEFYNWLQTTSYDGPVGKVIYPKYYKILTSIYFDIYTIDSVTFAYFDLKKYTLNPKLTVCSLLCLCRLFSADAIISRNSTFKCPDSPIGPETAKVQDSFEFL